MHGRSTHTNANHEKTQKGKDNDHAKWLKATNTHIVLAKYTTKHCKARPTHTKHALLSLSVQLPLLLFSSVLQLPPVSLILGAQNDQAIPHQPHSFEFRKLGAHLMISVFVRELRQTIRNFKSIVLH